MKKAGSSVLIPGGRCDAGQFVDALLVQALREEGDRCSPFGFLAFVPREMGWITFSPGGGGGSALLPQGRLSGTFPFGRHGSEELGECEEREGEIGNSSPSAAHGIICPRGKAVFLPFLIATRTTWRGG